MAEKRLHARRPDLDRLDDRCLLSAAPSGLSPAQVQAAYGLTSTNGGKGETIALIEAYHNSNLALELTKFDAQFGLTNPALTQVNLGSSGNTNSGWAEEEALDVEWAHAIAPGANILVVEAKSASTTDLLAAVKTAVADGANIVSMSWGGSEPSNEASLDATFATAGVTFVASSGDTANEGAQWPASSPYVVGVGGTTLKITTSGSTTTTTESAWDNSSGGSSGGESLYEAEPSYQESVQSSGKRSVPDVAFDADPNSGVAVYYISPTASAATVASSNPGTWLVVGGTSLGAPAWAAIVADLDQSVVATGGTNLSSTQTLQSLYNLQHDTPGDFNAVAATTTTAGTEFGFGGRFTGAQSTTDDYVGLGTPKAGSKFLSDLTGEAKATEAGTASKDGSGEKGTTATTPTGTFRRHRQRSATKTGTGTTTTGGGHV